jgi:serine/threonine-protein kinase
MLRRFMVDDAPPSSAHPMAVGSRVGRYRIDGLLGRGGMGEVYAAEDTALGRKVALKIVAFEAAGADARGAEAKARLLREARAAASLEHPNVVAVYDVGEHEGAAYLAMELVKGETLRERMRRPATPDEKLGWLVDVASALEAAHAEGIVHRDVKPENVMVKRDGRAKVLDFGIARRPVLAVDPSAPTAARDDRLATITAEGALVGTPLYMAPEQLHGGPLDGRADEFAWAVVAYELFAGRPPWSARDAVALIADILGRDAPSLAAASPDAPPALVAVVARALAKSADARFASMRDVIDALGPAPVETVTRPAALAPTPAAATRPASRRWPLLVALGGAAAIALGVVAASRAGSTAQRSSAAAPPATAAAPPARALAAVAMTDLPLPKSDVPAALAAYRAGMQAWRDGALPAAADAFEHAYELDPNLGAAYLRRAILGGWNDETDTLYRKASELRAALSPHEAAMLDALLPCAQSRAGADRHCVESTRRLAAAHPRDAELVNLHGAQLAEAGRFEEWLAVERAAIELDPKFAWARMQEQWALQYLGRFDEEDKSVDACMALSPSIGCLLSRSFVEAELGQGERLEATARAMLGISSTDRNALRMLARAAACLGRPTATMKSALDQVFATAPRDERPRLRYLVGLQIAVQSGDFAEVDRALDEGTTLLGENPSMGLQGQLARDRIVAARETGRPADAARAARAYLDVYDTLVGSRREEDSGLDQHATWWALDALRDGGRMTKPEVRVERDRFVADWRPRLGRDFQPYLWLATYASLARDADDAREALEVLPSFGGLPKVFETMPYQRAIGRVYALANRREEAVPWLEQAAHACLVGDARTVWAARDLGEVEEQLGHKDKACAAYALVLARWGNAKPRSLTAEDARKRRKSLACPP